MKNVGTQVGDPGLCQHLENSLVLFTYHIMSLHDAMVNTSIT